MSWQAVAAGLGALYQNQEAKRSAKRQMEFQASMSNTSWQRGMSDMKAAGLNPMLAYKMGGASSPAGAMYTPQNVGMAATDGYLKGTQADQAKAQTGLTQAQTQKVEAEAKRIEQSTEFERVVHDERWPRLFATMSAENVVASGLAVLEGVDIEQVLRNKNHQIPQEARKGLERFVYRVQGFKGTIAREMSGVGQKLDAAGKAIADKAKFFADIVKEMYGD
jgi:hypothetical protein